MPSLGTIGANLRKVAAFRVGNFLPLCLNSLSFDKLIVTPLMRSL